MLPTQPTPRINQCIRERQLMQLKAFISELIYSMWFFVQIFSVYGNVTFKLLHDSHFEEGIIGRFAENTSIEYSISSSSIDSNAITGAPVSYQENSDASTNFLANNIDFGEFMDSTADIYPNKLKHAVCGKLTIKYVIHLHCSHIQDGRWAKKTIHILIAFRILIRKIDVQCFPLPDALNPCEDVMGSQWLRTSVWIVVLLAVFGNIAVLLVLFSNW